MASIEKLELTDTMRMWRDKINAILGRVETNVLNWEDGHIQFTPEDGCVDFDVKVPATFRQIVNIGDIVIDPSSGVITATATTAQKLATAKQINNTDFDGSKNITTAKWGTARNINITDGVHTSQKVSVNGSVDISLLLPDTITASLNGNADTTTKLKTSCTINNTAFDGTKNITTAVWGQSRVFSISDSTSTNISISVGVNGSEDIVLFLPSTIKATLDGNATTSTTATKLKTPRTINNIAFDGSKNITIEDSTKLPLSGGTITGSLVVQNNITSKSETTQSITIKTTGKPNIDFYYANAVNMTSQIVETSSGTLAVNSTTFSNGNIVAPGTISANRVFNAVFNDYAEYFERGEETEPGDIIALDIESDEEQYIKATNSSECVIGVHSDSYAHIIGGKNVSEEENLKNFIPVGMAGRVRVKFIGKARKGMKVVPSDIPGVGKEYSSSDTPDSVIGYLVESNSSEDIKLVRMKIL